MTTTIKSSDRLSNAGYHRSGKSRWWLRSTATSTGGFVRIPDVRGDEVFEATIDLAPGEYVLGTGKGRDAIRDTIVVG